MTLAQSDAAIAVAAEPIGHREAKRWLATALAKHRLGGTFLLVGPPGIGKAALAKWVAMCLLCKRTAADRLECCGDCAACHQVAAETHPDLVQVRKPADRAFIPLDLLVGEKGLRMQQGFCRDIRLRSFQGTRKVAILHDADDLNEEGANSLLKTFEEPPPDAVIFLIGTSEQRQLPTIRSRCQIIRLGPPRGDEAAALLARYGASCDAEQAQQVIQACAGDCRAAAAMLSEQGAQLRRQLATLLGQSPISSCELARTLTGAIDELGKSASGHQKRDRLRDIFALSIQTFRRQMLAVADQPQRLDRIIYRLDRTVEAVTEVQRNANQSTLIECWAADIARGWPA